MQIINMRLETCVFFSFIINITPEFVKFDITELTFGFKLLN